tara:strand:+ start:7678 stop:9396 length:1719 start_codon:yes stop_codon:yes gene_type:complete
MDRVKLVPLQRLDLEDTRALHDLPYEHMRRLIGALLGSGDVVSNAGGGLLSMPHFAYDSVTKLLSLESFSYLELTKGGADLVEISNADYIGTPEARIVRFNSADTTENINSPLDLSGHSTNNNSYDVYIRWYRKDLDTQARRKWDTSLQNEVPFSPQTRERERVEFKTLLGGIPRPTDSTSLDIGKWVKIFSYKITSNILVLDGYHALDNSKEIRDRFLNPALPNNEDILSIDPTLQYNANAITGFDGSSTEKSKTIGISQVLTMIRGQLARILHTGTDDTNAYSYSSGDSWLNAPLMSLRGLRQEVTSIYSRITTAESNINIGDTNTTTNTTDITNLDTGLQNVYSNFIRHESIVLLEYVSGSSPTVTLREDSIAPVADPNTAYDVYFQQSFGQIFAPSHHIDYSSFQNTGSTILQTINGQGQGSGESHNRRLAHAFREIFISVPSAYANKFYKLDIQPVMLASHNDAYNSFTNDPSYKMFHGSISFGLMASELPFSTNDSKKYFQIKQHTYESLEVNGVRPSITAYGVKFCINGLYDYLNEVYDTLNPNGQQLGATEFKIAFKTNLTIYN